jgi:DNA-binding LytR/AlgR family response regulator
MTIDELLKILPTDNFVRTHKSFIVAIDKIDFIERNKVYINTNSIPIGKLFKEQFLNKSNLK